VTRHVNAINAGGSSPDSSSVTVRTLIHQAGSGRLLPRRGLGHADQRYGDASAVAHLRVDRRADSAVAGRNGVDGPSRPTRTRTPSATRG
jgi:hypothetical protein